MLILLVSLFQLSAADFDLRASLKKIEDHYNNIRTMQVDFVQTLSFAVQPGAKRTESGVLFLKKPGKMRWEYREPSKKLFVSDGKDVYFYTSASNRVEKSKLKETEDMRAPLAFLIGRLDFDRDFKEYRIRQEGQSRWITAIPKSDKAPYREVQFLLQENAQIGQLKVLGQDQSIMEFVLKNEKANPSLADSLFQFVPPAGAEVVVVGEP